MTLRQVINITEGHFEGKRRDHESRVLEARILLTYYASMKDEKDNRKFKDIYRIEADDHEEKKDKLSKEVFGPLLVNFFKATSK